MANRTINLPLIKAGYTDKDQPFTVIPVNPNSSYVGAGNRKILFFGYDSFPDSLKYKPLIDVSVVVQGYFYSTDAYASVGWGWVYLCEDFDPSTLTFNHQPSKVSSSFSNLEYSKGVWQDAISFPSPKGATKAYFYHYPTRQKSPKNHRFS